MVSVLIMDIKLKTGLVSWQFKAIGGWREIYVSDAWWMDDHSVRNGCHGHRHSLRDVFSAPDPCEVSMFVERLLPR